MKIPFVDLKAQYNSIKPEIDSAISEVIEETAFIGGKFVKQFENDFSKYVGSNCISCANGTDAIQIILKAISINKEDEVIVPANSFIATSEAVTAAGGKVVFCDVDDDTNNFDLNKLEATITKSTKIIMPVHLYGHPCDMHSVMEIAARHSITVIEDSAQAHGAKFGNKMAGTFGHAATFSFYPGKNLGAYGDAGAIITHDDQLAKKCKMMANHGRIDKYNHEFEAYNSRMDGIQAAILSVKLKHLDNWIENRRRVAAYYSSGLKGVGDIKVPVESKDAYAVYHLYVIKSDYRDKLQSYLKENGVSTGIHYPIGLPFLKAYNYMHHTESDFPVTAGNQNRILSLPIFPEMEESQIQYIIDTIKQFFTKVA